MKKVKFVGKVIRQTYFSENYKMYALDVNDEKYPNLKHTIYGNVCIGGNLHSLTPGSEYYIEAEEKSSSKGYKYEVLNIRKTDLRNEEDVYAFLQEILTFNQASELYKHYPQIIDLVVNGRSNEVDLNKLHGIKEYTFNKIKDKIIENYALFDLISEFKGVLTISMLKKLYEKYPSIEKIRSELRIHPYKTLVGLSRVGFKTADKLLLEMEKEGIIKFAFDLKTSKERCMACVMYFLEDNETSNGNTKMKIVDLRKHVLTLTPACADHFVECLNEGKEKGNIYYDKDIMDVALMNTYMTELLIAGIVTDAVKNKNHIWNIDWKSYKDKGEYVLSDEQLLALGLACNKQITILCGFAGSGKTATTNTLIKMLIDNNKTFELCASTGRAAKVLSSYTGMPAATIHRAYGYIPPDEWGYNNENKIETDIVIVDEASMCDIFLFYRLLDGIDFNKTKLFIIGDPAQLCSVSAGNLLNDLIDSKKVPTATLTKIFRYNEGGLMQVATDTRNCKQFLKEAPNEKYVFFGENKDFGFLQCENDKIIKNLCALYKGLLDKGISPSDIMVLSAQNKGNYGTVAINNELQKIANKNCDPKSKKFFKIGDVTYYENDIIIQTKNNYHAIINENYFGEDPKETMVANGETMTIKEITPFYIILDLDGIEIRYTRNDMIDTALAYSISTHKSQGGSAKIIIFIVPPAHTFMLNSNLLYVGFTRTKERCFTIGDLTTINRAIKKKENIQRQTFLKDLLCKVKES